jgi:cold-inducible RNA-binding protein
MECRMTIYIGNMSAVTTEAQLRQAFERFGSVAVVNIIRDKKNGQSRGFAFVEMSTGDEAAAAISGLNGEDLDGCTLTVGEAKSHA